MRHSPELSLPEEAQERDWHAAATVYNQRHKAMKMKPCYLFFPLIVGILTAPVAYAQEQSTAPAIAGAQSGALFNDVADKALATMKKRAEELKIKGAAVVAYFEGESIQSWSSKMLVVGIAKNPPTQKDPGNNLVAIAYAKACEMTDTLKDSGSNVRPPMKGELGWQGGVIKKTKTGYVIAAFSGGPSEDDIKVSKAGLEVLASQL